MLYALMAGEGFTFTADMFSSIGTTILSAAPIILTVGVPIMAISIGIGFLVSKIRKVAK